MKKIFADKKIVILAIIYFVLTAIYAWWTYGLVTPNLVLVNNPDFWQWQTWMWQHIYNNHQLRTLSFAILIAALFAVYIALARRVNRQIIDRKMTAKKFFLLAAFIAVPLFFSYNALSADVFNYIFNAKMLIELGANPHVQVAQDFPTEPMLRFMHNSHTAAPYGYLFTVVSLPFYLLGAGKFILQWLAMRIMSTIALIGGGVLVWKMWQRHNHVGSSSAWIFLNPLILLEFISNNHNDWWMIAPALGAFYLIMNTKKKLWRIIVSAVLLLLSTQIKFATVILLPFWIFLVVEQKFWQKVFVGKHLKNFLAWLEKYCFDLMALAMFVPLLTPRAQFFHPWYLSWSLAWWPLCRARGVKYLLLIFSFTAMLRYLAYFYFGEYNQTETVISIMITFLGAALLGGVIYFSKILFRSRKI